MDNEGLDYTDVPSSAYTPKVHIHMAQPSFCFVGSCLHIVWCHFNAFLNFCIDFVTLCRLGMLCKNSFRHFEIFVVFFLFFFSQKIRVDSACSALFSVNNIVLC